MERRDAFGFRGPGGKGSLLAEFEGGGCRRGSAVLGGPFGDELVGFKVDEAGAVREFADKIVVDASEMLAGVVSARSRRADFCIGAQVPVEGVE